MTDAGGLGDPGQPAEGREQTPPLECAFCYAPRWNDESVTWWPLYGPNRLPYCRWTCAPYIQAEKKIKRNGGLEVWAALHNQDVEWFA